MNNQNNNNTPIEYYLKQIAVYEEDLKRRVEELKSKGWWHIHNEWDEDLGLWFVYLRRPKKV